MQTQAHKFAHSIFPKQSARIAAEVVEFLTNNGEHTRTEALKFWEEGPRRNLRIARLAGWQPRGDWAAVWPKVREILETVH